MKPSPASSAREDLAQLEARTVRFEEVVRESQLRAPPTKDFVRDAIRRRGVRRLPVWLRRVTVDVVIRHGELLESLFREYPDDLGRVAAADMMLGWRGGCTPPLSPVEAFLRESAWTNEWGVPWRHSADGVGATEVGHPLDDWAKLDEYLARIPDPLSPGRFDAAVGPARAFREKGTYGFGLLGPVFYHVFSIRGMENALMDFHTNPEELRRLVAALLDHALGLLRIWGTLGVDGVFFLDDWGTQRALLLSPAIWRDFFKEGYATLIREAHSLGMDVFLHSCGNVTAIVEDLIEIGLDVLDPVQTSAMDLDELARRFGGRISFCGTIDVQDLLPRGNPTQVKDAIRRARDTLGRPFGGGLVLAPTNTITPEVPPENLRAMFEACREE